MNTMLVKLPNGTKTRIVNNTQKNGNINAFE